MDDRVIVVVPIHRRELSEDEEVCLWRCSGMLAPWRKYFLAPAGLALDGLEERYGFDGTIERASCFFGSQWTYNWMMLDHQLYALFEPYRFVLVHQLDAFLFRRNLEEFLALDFDYFGAPWPHWFSTRALGGPIGAVGNGGLSLRSVEKSKNALLRCIDAPADLLRAGIPGPGGLGTFYNKAELLARSGRFRDRAFRRVLLNWQSNEDIFWALVAPRIGVGFRAAPLDVAAQFAIDLDPEEFLGNPIDSELPFGCHGWASNAAPLWMRIRAAVAGGLGPSEELRRLS